MVYKTLRNKKAKSSVAKILTSAETDDYHLMSRWTARAALAHIGLADLYWLSYWDIMVSLDRWVIIACLDIENILLSHFC
jgi:hypothetical protein